MTCHLPIPTNPPLSRTRYDVIQAAQDTLSRTYVLVYRMVATGSLHGGFKAEAKGGIGDGKGVRLIQH